MLLIKTCAFWIVVYIFIIDLLMLINITQRWMS